MINILFYEINRMIKRGIMIGAFILLCVIGVILYFILKKKSYPNITPGLIPVKHDIHFLPNIKHFSKFIYIILDYMSYTYALVSPLKSALNYVNYNSPIIIKLMEMYKTNINSTIDTLNRGVLFDLPLFIKNLTKCYYILGELYTEVKAITLDNKFINTIISMFTNITYQNLYVINQFPTILNNLSSTPYEISMMTLMNLITFSYSMLLKELVMGYIEISNNNSIIPKDLYDSLNTFYQLLNMRTEITNINEYNKFMNQWNNQLNDIKSKFHDIKYYGKNVEELEIVASFGYWLNNSNIYGDYISLN